MVPHTSPVVMVNQLEHVLTRLHTPCMYLYALSLSSWPRSAPCRGQSCVSLHLYLHKKSLAECTRTCFVTLIFFSYIRLHQTKQKETRCTSVGIDLDNGRLLLSFSTTNDRIGDEKYHKADYVPSYDPIREYNPFWHGNTGLAKPFHARLTIYGPLKYFVNSGCLRLAHVKSRRTDAET